MTLKIENPRALLQERRQIVSDIVRQNKKPKRIPIFSQAYAWPIFDAGYKLNEALSDLDKMFELTCRFHEIYNHDFYIDKP